MTMTDTLAYDDTQFAPLATAPVKEASIRNLKVALGISVVLCFSILGLFKFGGFMAAHKPQKKINIMIVPYAELGPPPSLTNQQVAPNVAIASAAAPPSMGVPVPVPTEEATTEATATQTELAMSTTSTSNATGGDSVVITRPEDLVPMFNEFVAYDTPPAPLETPHPEYPAIAKQAGIEGTTIVQILLDLDGGVMQTRVARSSGNQALDEAAADGAKKFKFTPAKQRDKSVRVWVSMPIVFRLEK
jgi:protein TonB